MSLAANINEKANLIWAIADKLTGVYKPHEYGEVILPLTVIRRFDCILSETKDAVLKKYKEVKNLPMKDILLRAASGKPFYNTSKFTFERLIDDPDHIETNFRDYLLVRAKKSWLKSLSCLMNWKAAWRRCSTCEEDEGQRGAVDRGDTGRVESFTYKTPL